MTTIYFKIVTDFVIFPKIVSKIDHMRIKSNICLYSRYPFYLKKTLCSQALNSLLPTLKKKKKLVFFMALSYLKYDWNVI